MFNLKTINIFILRNKLILKIFNQDSFIQNIIAEESNYLYENTLSKRKTLTNDLNQKINRKATNSLRLIEQENFFDFSRHEINLKEMSQEQRKIYLLNFLLIKK